MEQHSTVADVQSSRAHIWRWLKSDLFPHSKQSLKSGIINVVERGLGNVVPSRRVLTVSKADMHSFVQKKSVSDTVIQSVMSSMRPIVRIAITTGEMVDRAVDEYDHTTWKKHRQSHWLLSVHRMSAAPHNETIKQIIQFWVVWGAPS